MQVEQEKTLPFLQCVHYLKVRYSEFVEGVCYMTMVECTMQYNDFSHCAEMAEQ
jgi:hypothetical protein